jgi:tetratricopeptide (TPR) repeat protein
LKASGIQLFQQGQTEQAIARFEAAASAFEGAGNVTAAAEMWNNVGVAQRRLKRWEAAVSALEMASARFQALGDKVGQGQTLANLGDVYSARRERTIAARLYSEASALLAGAGDKARQSQVLRALSLEYLRQANFPQAMIIMEQSLAIRPRRGLGGWLFHGILKFALRLSGIH